MRQNVGFRHIGTTHLVLRQAVFEDPPSWKFSESIYTIIQSFVAIPNSRSSDSCTTNHSRYNSQVPHWFVNMTRLRRSFLVDDSSMKSTRENPCDVISFDGDHGTISGDPERVREFPSISVRRFKAIQHVWCILLSPLWQCLLFLLILWDYRVHSFLWKWNFA